MKKLVLLCFTLLLGITMASAQEQNNKDSNIGFLDVTEYSSSSLYIQLSFFDTRGYIAEHEVYYPEHKYLLDKVKVVVRTSDNKKYTYASDTSCGIEMDKELAGQTIQMKVSRKGYKTLKTTWDVPQPTKLRNNIPSHNIDVEVDCYYHCNVFLASKGGELPQPKIPTVNVEYKIGKDNQVEVLQSNQVEIKQLR